MRARHWWRRTTDISLILSENTAGGRGSARYDDLPARRPRAPPRQGPRGLASPNGLSPLSRRNTRSTVANIVVRYRVREDPSEVDLRNGGDNSRQYARSWLRMRIASRLATSTRFSCVHLEKNVKLGDRPSSSIAASSRRRSLIAGRAAPDAVQWIEVCMP